VLKILTLVFVLGHVYLHEEQLPLFIVRDLGVAQDFLSSVVENKKFIQFQFPLNLTWWSVGIVPDCRFSLLRSYIKVVKDNLKLPHRHLTSFSISVYSV
jgi:hypothetical protein